MTFGTTIVFYLLIGAGVGAGMLVLDSRASTVGRVLLATSALVFWPLYLPGLLERGGRLVLATDPTTFSSQTEPAWDSSLPQRPSAPPNDDIAVGVAQRGR